MKIFGNCDKCNQVNILVTINDEKLCCECYELKEFLTIDDVVGLKSTFHPLCHNCENNGTYGKIWSDDTKWNNKKGCYIAFCYDCFQCHKKLYELKLKNL